MFHDMIGPEIIASRSIQFHLKVRSLTRVSILRKSDEISIEMTLDASEIENAAIKFNYIQKRLQKN